MSLLTQISSIFKKESGQKPNSNKSYGMPNLEEIIKTTLYYRSGIHQDPNYFDNFGIDACVNRINMATIYPTMDNSVTQHTVSYQQIALIHYAIMEYEDAKK